LRLAFHEIVFFISLAGLTYQQAQAGLWRLVPPFFMCYAYPMIADYSLYLQVGDHVFHKRFMRWGMGVVVEERRSELPGGFCYVRINFQDGKVRVFDNNYKSVNCCYYAGIEKIEERYIELEEARQPKRREKKMLPR
jgi:hypothetical protein